MGLGAEGGPEMTTNQDREELTGLFDRVAKSDGWFSGEEVLAEVEASAWLVGVRREAAREALLQAANEYPTSPRRGTWHASDWLRARAGAVGSDA